MEGSVAVIPTGSATREEPEKLRRGKITPPSTVQAAGRRKATGKAQLVKQDDVIVAKTVSSLITDENVVQPSSGGLKVKVSPKLLDFDVEGMFLSCFVVL